MHFKVTHSGAYCPASELNDVMFHLKLLAMPRTAFGAGSEKVVIQVSLEPFVFRVSIAKS